MNDQLVDEAEIFADCVDSLEAGRSTAEQCQELYQETGPEMQELLLTTQLMRKTLTAKPSATYKARSRAQLISKLQPLPAESLALFPALSRRIGAFFMISRPSAFRLAWVLSIVLVAVVLLGVGTAYAADSAVPGEPLYGLDRSLEEIQAQLTKDPKAIVTLNLAFADERLLEAQGLAEGEGTGDFQDALNDYIDTIDSVVQIIGTSAIADSDHLSRILDDAIVVHDVKLFRLAVADGSEEDDEAALSRFCGGSETHPVVQSMAEQYDVDSGQIMNWFCGSDQAPGLGLGQIMLALRKQDRLDQNGPSAQEMLRRRVEGEGWGQIWQDLGLLGKKNADDLPERAGPKGDKKSNGDDSSPSDDSSPGDEKGPPDHANSRSNRESSDGDRHPGNAGSKDKADSSGDSDSPGRSVK